MKSQNNNQQTSKTPGSYAIADDRGAYLVALPDPGKPNSLSYNTWTRGGADFWKSSRPMHIDAMKFVYLEDAEQVLKQMVDANPVMAQMHNWRVVGSSVEE